MTYEREAVNNTIRVDF